MADSDKRECSGIQELWESVLKRMLSKISKPSFDQWISPLAVQEKGENKLVLIAPNEFVGNWVDKRYKKELTELVNELSDRPYHITVSWE